MGNKQMSKERPVHAEWMKSMNGLNTYLKPEETNDQPRFAFVVDDYTKTIPDQLTNKKLDQKWSDSALVPGGTLFDFSGEEFLLRISIKISEYIDDSVSLWKRDNKVGIDHSINQNSFSIFLVRAKNKLDSASLLFAEDHFTKPNYSIRVSGCGRMISNSSVLVQRKPRSYRTPSIIEIYTFIAEILNLNGMMKECLILCLIYVERLLQYSHIYILPCNWRCILLGSLILSSKAWNDTPPANSTFLKVYPQFDLTGINNLEALFLAHIQWNSFVTGSLYAKYYFAIRALDENERFKQKHWYMKHICKFSDSPSPSSRKSSYSESKKLSTDDYFSMSL